jgi:formylglycine-generating enzyme required for sulfatase activity
MLQKLLLITTFLMLFISAGEAGDKGKVRIGANIQEAMIYANSKPKAMTGEGHTTLLLDEGMYELKVEKITDNGDYIYTQTKKIFVGEDTTININFELSKTATQKRIARLAKQRSKQVKNVGLFMRNGYIEPNMILVKAGSFKMGSNENNDERPIHNVSIKKDFYVSRYEVTFDEYDLFCESTGKVKPKDEGWGRGLRPVINVSYNDVIEYIKWLNEKSGKNYRLLSEEEWEYAARAGSSTKWNFGSNEAELTKYAWYDKNSESKTHEVGTKKINAWGIYDMYGNIWEWTSDWYSDNYTKNRQKKYKIFRGGSWSSKAINTRSSNRFDNSPAIAYYNLGFRLSRTLP